MPRAASHPRRSAAILAVAIATQLLDGRKELWIGLAAIEERDAVPACQRELRHVHADELGATENQDA